MRPVASRKSALTIAGLVAATLILAACESTRTVVREVKPTVVSTQITYDHIGDTEVLWLRRTKTIETLYSDRTQTKNTRTDLYRCTGGADGAAPLCQQVRVICPESGGCVTRVEAVKRGPSLVPTWEQAVPPPPVGDEEERFCRTACVEVAEALARKRRLGRQICVARCGRDAGVRDCLKQAGADRVKAVACGAHVDPR